MTDHVKPQLHTKFEVVDFINCIEIYENFLKIGINQNREPLIFFGEADFTIGYIDPMFPIQCTTCVKLYDFRNW